MDAQAIWLTVRLAAVTSGLLAVVSLPLAWWLASGRGLGRAVVQAVVALPLMLPPTVLGFYLLVMMGPLTAPGRVLIRIVGHPLAFSFAGLLVGSVLYSLPFAVQPMVAAFRAVDREYLEAAAALGASPWRVARTVVAPMVRGALVTSAILTFTHTVGEFGVVLMLGGNIPGETRTLSISLYDLVEEGRYGEANRTAALLIAVAVVALVGIYLVPTRARGRGVLIG